MGLAWSLPLRFVGVGADDVLGDLVAVFRHPLVVETGGVGVSLLRAIGRTIAFDRAFVAIGFFALLSLHRFPPFRLEAEAPYNPSDMSERTLAIIKPDAVAARYSGRIIQRIEDAGFTIRAMRLVNLSQKDAEGFYAVHRQRPFFASLTRFMSSGPAIVIALEAPDAIKKWRTLMGATDPAKADAGTLRRDFGASIEFNATHGSDAPETAAFELGYFFRGMELA